MRSARSAWGIVALLALAACAAEDAPTTGTAQAPSWLVHTDSAGTWLVADEPDVVHAWVDASVANVRYHKRVLVEVAAPYAGGVFVRTLLPASYRSGLAGNRERWGTDAIEIYPVGPGGRRLAGPVAYRIRVQHDVDADGTDDMATTAWQALHGDGDLVLPDNDPWDAVQSPANGTNAMATPDVFFPPHEDPGPRLLAEIDAIIARQRDNPDARHTLHAAIYNINDEQLIAKVIEAHQAGVEVRLIMDGRKFRPWYDWYFGDDRLLEAGVPVLGVKREATGAMHDKILLLDGRAVTTGSMNWEHGARFENDENVLVTDDAELVAAYAARFEVLAGGVQRARKHATDRLYFAPDEEAHRVMGRVIDDAQSTIQVAMFTAKDVAYWDNGRRTSLLQKLVDAHRRGVDVRVIVDHGVHEASEFYGVETEDDQTDEWLEDQGIHVVRADNTLGRYASMHHKFVVIDGATVVTGAFNWYYDAAFRNDEDLLVLRDPAAARRYGAEFVDLLRRYDTDFDPTEWPMASIDVRVHHDATQWGDTVVLVGAHDSLGNWDPARGVRLGPSSWPVWTVAIELPLGLHVAHKFVVVGADGRVTWESGANRSLAAYDGAVYDGLTFRR